MKFYEDLDPVERKKLVLRPVAFDSYLEGMDASMKACLGNLAALEHWDKASLLEAMRDVAPEAVMDILGDAEVLDALRHAQTLDEPTRPAAEFFDEITNE